MFSEEGGDGTVSAASRRRDPLWGGAPLGRAGVRLDFPAGAVAVFLRDAADAGLAAAFGRAAPVGRGDAAGRGAGFDAAAAFFFFPAAVALPDLVLVAEAFFAAAFRAGPAVRVPAEAARVRAAGAFFRADFEAGVDEPLALRLAMFQSFRQP